MSKSEGVSFDRFASVDHAHDYGMSPANVTDHARMMSVFRRLGDGGVLCYAAGLQVTRADLDRVQAQLQGTSADPEQVPGEDLELDGIGRVQLRAGDDGQLIATALDLTGCVTQGRDRATALANLREAAAVSMPGGRMHCNTPSLPSRVRSVNIQVSLRA